MYYLPPMPDDIHPRRMYYGTGGCIVGYAFGNPLPECIRNQPWGMNLFAFTAEKLAKARNGDEKVTRHTITQDVRRSLKSCFPSRAELAVAVREVVDRADDLICICKDAVDLIARYSGAGMTNVKCMKRIARRYVEAKRYQLN